MEVISTGKGKASLIEGEKNNVLKDKQEVWQIIILYQSNLQD